MRLYYSPNSCALASHIILEEVGADYSLELVDFTKSEQKQADYLKINPKARVPALQTGDGIITETPSILFFLAQSFPSKNLAPLDQPFKLAQAQEFNSYYVQQFMLLMLISAEEHDGLMIRRRLRQ